MHKSTITIALVLLCCDAPKRSAIVPRPEVRARIAAANGLALQDRVRASAAGGDCDVLLVQASTALDDATVEAMQYVGGAAVAAGGVEQYSRQHAFRGVTYRDSTGRVWTYGSVGTGEAEALTPCR